MEWITLQTRSLVAQYLTPRKHTGNIIFALFCSFPAEPEAKLFSHDVKTKERSLKVGVPGKEYVFSVYGAPKTVKSLSCGWQAEKHCHTVKTTKFLNYWNQQFPQIERTTRHYFRKLDSLAYKSWLWEWQWWGSFRCKFPEKQEK